LSRVLEAQDDDDTDYLPTKASATKRRLTTAKPKKGEQSLPRGLNRRGSTQDLSTPSRAAPSKTKTTTPRCAVKHKGGFLVEQPRAVDVGVDDENDDSKHVGHGRRRQDGNAAAAVAAAAGMAKHGGDRKPSGQEPVKTKKNTDPIFGIPRHQELCRPLERADQVEYAWSADVAEFAMVCGRAKYALKADRVHHFEHVGDKDKNRNEGKEDGEENDEENDKENNKKHVRQALCTLMKLHTRFGIVEATQRSRAAQDAEKAQFAGCADRATYAADAEEAEYSKLSTYHHHHLAMSSTIRNNIYLPIIGIQLLGTL
ncbi:hypothetical protein E4U43_006534, partial [Claviceps pusilla]